MSEANETNEEPYFDSYTQNVAQEMGMPEEAIQQFARQSPQTGLANAMGLIGFLVVLIGLVFLVVWYGFGPGILAWVEWAGLVPEDILWVATPFASGIVMIFASIFIAGWIAGLFTLLSSRRARSSAVTSLYNLINPKDAANAAVYHFFARRIIKASNKRFKPGADYLMLFSKVSKSWASKWAFIFTIIAMGLFAWETTRVSYFNADGFVCKPYFSTETINYTWEDAEKLTTGCYYRDKDHQLEYNVYFGDGRSVDFKGGDFQPKGMTRFEAMEWVDARLRSLSTPWERARFQGGINKGELAWSDACFEHHRKEKSGEELERFDRLYRYSSPE